MSISLPFGTVERRSGSDIHIDLRGVPVDAAVAIIKILRAHAPKENE